MKLRLLLPFFALLAIGACKKDEIPSYTLTVTAGEGGSVSPTEKIFSEGQKATISAAPDANHKFVRWIGDVTSTQNPFTFSMDDNKTVLAEFASIDSDQDGIPDDIDQCEDTSGDTQVDANGCSQAQKDSDNDGISDDIDQCSDTPTGEEIDENGCAASQKDSDNDGIQDDIDQCPNTPLGEAVNENGCANTQLDTDGDGVSDNIDQCPETPEGETVTEDGCGESQLENQDPLVYAIKSDVVSETQTTKFVSIDPSNGSKVNLIDLQTTDNCESASINQMENIVYFITSLGDGNLDTEIITIDVNSSTFSTVSLNSDPEIDYELVPTHYGTLYAIKQSYISEVITSKLVSIDPANGNETELLDLQTTDNFNSLVYNPSTDEIYGVTNIGDGNTDCELYTINPDKKTFSLTTISNQYRYELALSANGVLYGLQQTFDHSSNATLYRINPYEGSKTVALDMQTRESFQNLIFKSKSIMGATNIDSPNIDSEIYNVDIESNSFSFTDLNSTQGINFELIYPRK